MKISGIGSAGTAESGDALVVVDSAASGITLDLAGPSIARYGDEIRSEVLATLSALGIEAATVRLQEKGALDCTIKARLAAACLRASVPVGSADSSRGAANAVPPGPVPSIPWEAMP